MYARVTTALLGALLTATVAGAQTPTRIYAIDPSGFDRVIFGDGANSAIRTVQVAGSQVATSYWTFRITDGTNYLAPSLDYTQDVALTVATTAGPVVMGRASTTAPTAVSTANDAVMAWFLPTGALVGSTAASADAGIAGTECNVLSAASTNATSCKASGANWYGYDLINTTTTTYYLRLYNLATAPTCSSATGFIRSIPIPPAGAAGQAGGAIRQFVIPVNYATGLAYCITAGGASTDNTSAATGVFGALLYR